METPPAKPTLAAVGGFAAGIIWPLLAVFNSTIGAMGAPALSAITLNTAGFIGGILYYLVPQDGFHWTRKSE